MLDECAPKGRYSALPCFLLVAKCNSASMKALLARIYDFILPRPVEIAENGMS